MILYGDSKYENKVNKNILLASVNFVLSSRRFEDQLMWRSLHGKPYFFFQTSWKDRLSKQFALECELFCIIGKDDISFSWKYDLTPDGKWRMIFLKKYTEIWYFLQTFWKDGLFKKGRAGTSLYYLERRYFFPDKIFFPWAGSERWTFSINTRKYDIFCVRVRVLEMWCHALLPKKSKMVLSYKKTPKDGWRSRLTS